MNLQEVLDKYLAVEKEGYSVDTLLESIVSDLKFLIEEEKKPKYTVLVNYGEYSTGVFNSEEEAIAEKVMLIKERYPEAKEYDDETLANDFDVDGYFEVMPL